MEFNRLIDHTILKADARREDVERICKEAKEYHFKSACINPCWVKYAHELLKGTDTAVCTVIGFPLGATSTKSKVAETACAVEDGADEIDMVINIGWLKDNENDLVREEIRAIKEACDGKLLKVIIETCLLSEEEKVRACLLSKEAGADFVKTSTGFSTGGATAEDVKLMRETVGPDMGVKASGGIQNRADAEKMVLAGATRLGCSKGVKIVRGE